MWGVRGGSGGVLVLVARAFGGGSRIVRHVPGLFGRPAIAPPVNNRAAGAVGGV
ncbi:hypothetical protein HMPREF1550_00281 [Actinomyces sp. oral taxon 877 str. F0543]|nr:hypothetical protein HMPREF1550_00281 [Actinomyces sp. oral taxon 877 str. F0543]